MILSELHLLTSVWKSFPYGYKRGLEMTAANQPLLVLHHVHKTTKTELGYNTPIHNSHSPAFSASTDN